jgi:hypothetical protein
VDFDPEVARSRQFEGLNVRFGDAASADFLETLPLDGVRWVVSTLPELGPNRAMLHALVHCRYGGEIAVVAREEQQGLALKQAGFPTVLYPFKDAADFAARELATLIATEKAQP